MIYLSESSPYVSVCTIQLIYSPGTGIASLLICFSMFRSLVGLWVVTLSGVCPPADMVARIFLLISLPVVCARLLLPWPISVGKIFLSQLSACK